MDNVMRIGFGIMAGLAVSAVLTVVLVAVAGLHIGLGLGLLALLDVLIIGCGFGAVRRATRAGG
jgi:hypothetical protein